MHSPRKVVSLLSVVVAGAWAQGPDSLETAFGRRLEAGKGRFDSAVAGARTVSLEGGWPVAGGGGERGVPLEDFRRVLEAVGAELNPILTKPELAGMRAYVQRGLAGMEVETRNTSWGPCVRERDARKVFESINQMFNRLQKLDKLKIDLAVITEPPEAKVQIVALGGGIPTITTSNATITNLYRGIYTYRVEKAGYRMVEGPVNLVDERGTKLNCRLAGLADAGGSAHCRLQE